MNECILFLLTGVYLVTIMILTSISVALCVFILHIHMLGESPVRVPKWLHLCTSRYLARLVGMSYIVRHRQAVNAAQITAQSEETKPLRIECEELNARYKLIQVEGNGLYILAKDGDSTPLEKDDKEELNDLHRVKESGNVIRAMNAIMVENPVTYNENRGYMKNQLLWHDIAEIVDRLFFWMCFFTITISTVSILVILPLSKPDPLTIDR